MSFNDTILHDGARKTIKAYLNSQVCAKSIPQIVAYCGLMHSFTYTTTCSAVTYLARNNDIQRIQYGWYKGK